MLKQLSPSGSVKCGGYIPRRFASRNISTAIHSCILLCSCSWLVISRSGFCSTVQPVYFCFGARPPNAAFATKRAKKKALRILSFLTLKLREEAKKIEHFPKFQRWMKKTNIFKCKPLEVHFTIRNSLVLPRTATTSNQYPVRPSCWVSKRLWFNL